MGFAATASLRAKLSAVKFELVPLCISIDFSHKPYRCLVYVVDCFVLSQDAQ